MKIDVHNIVGKVVDSIDVDKKLLITDSNPSVVRQAVLSELANKGFDPIVLNTSFNKQGKPILNTMNEAKWMLENTGLDDLVVL